MTHDSVLEGDRQIASESNISKAISLEDGVSLITKSPEHHFVTTLGKLKKNPLYWSIQHYEISKLNAQKSDLHDVSGYYKAMRDHRAAQYEILNQIMEHAVALEYGYVYLLTDGDIVIMSKNEESNSDHMLHDIFALVSHYVGHESLCAFNRLEGSFYHYQKLAEEKLLIEKRLFAFAQLADENKVGSITQRRKNRDEPMIMVVEDDRFTASYTANILNKKYDMVVCRNGEEAVACYLEYAPDIVFLDIHLPGMSGHDVLKVIKSVDSKAHIVMLSVDAVPRNITVSTQEGAYGFLKKPFSKERLINTVRASPFIRSYMAANLSSDGNFVN